MLAGLDGRRCLLRVEIGRRLDHHCVQLALQQALVSLQTAIPTRGVDLQQFARLVHTVLEEIGTCHKTVLACFGEQRTEPVAPSAAANQSQFE